MDAAKKVADAEKKQLEEEFDELETLLKVKPPVITDITLQLQTVDQQLEEFGKAHQLYLDQLLAADEDVKMKDELKARNVLRKRKLKAVADTNALISAGPGGTKVSSGIVTHSHPDLYRVHLPKREMQKFDGDVRNWRSFWASFQEIDTDSSIPDMEKYHYLLQAMIPGSRPQQIVKSYPPDATSYALARDELNDKFGRKKTIIKVYIRDLLKQVVENSKEKKGDFTQMVTSLTAQIRSLEQLGVTQDNSGVILYAIVECCIPQEVLNRYLQSPGVKEEVSELLDFLNKEVKRLDETALAQGSFDDDSQKKQQGRPQQQKSGNGKASTPTAATFINADGKSAHKCGFCGNKHSTQDCRKAASLTLEQRRNALKSNGCCFRCLQFGHGSRNCSSKVVCILCKNSHHVLMCWEANKSSKEDSQGTASSGDSTAIIKVDRAAAKVLSAGESSGATTSTGMSNYISKPEVLLQTLYIRIYGKKGYKTIRAMFDSGSQSSYITRKLLAELDSPFVGKEKVVHQTFGGNMSKEVEHDVHLIEVSGIHHPYDHRYNFRVSVMDVIARGIIAPKDGVWMKEAGDMGIRLTDVNGGSEEEVQLMIGNDISPYMKQGLKSALLPCNLVVTETRIGWILEGKVKGSESICSNKTMVCINMQISDLDVSQLWALETIGIRDSPASQTRKEMEESAMDHFQSTASQDLSGRFQVHLPWIEGHRKLPENKNVALASLHRTTKQLLKDERLGDYHDIFMSWLEEGIIERVPSSLTSSSKSTGLGIIHYLPHRAVYKDNSTTPTRPVFNASSKGGQPLIKRLSGGWTEFAGVNPIYLHGIQTGTGGRGLGHTESISPNQSCREGS